jgi:hypothetical protein
MVIRTDSKPVNSITEEAIPFPHNGARFYFKHRILLSSEKLLKFSFFKNKQQFIKNRSIILLRGTL